MKILTRILSKSTKLRTIQVIIWIESCALTPAHSSQSPITESNLSLANANHEMNAIDPDHQTFNVVLAATSNQANIQVSFLDMRIADSVVLLPARLREQYGTWALTFIMVTRGRNESLVDSLG